MAVTGTRRRGPLERTANPNFAPSPLPISSDEDRKDTRSAMDWEIAGAFSVAIEHRVELPRPGIPDSGERGRAKGLPFGMPAPALVPASS